jgi:hypothetical protein
MVMVNGRWSMVDGQTEWLMVNGQWLGHQALAISHDPFSHCPLAMDHDPLPLAIYGA